jgi:hypothetical protein
VPKRTTDPEGSLPAVREPIDADALGGEKAARGAAFTERRHVRTFDAVMATLTRSLSANPPLSCAELTADLERLLHTLETCGWIEPSPAERKHLRVLAKGETPGSGKPGKEALNGDGPEVAFFAKALRCARGKRAEEFRAGLARLRDDRALLQYFFYSRLGLFRSNFFLSIYGDFTLCHEHPFLPQERMVVGPRFDRSENEKLQRKFRLMAFSTRREHERTLLKQLNEHADLSVVRARTWLDDPLRKRLTPWEAEQGDIVFFSEGAYYFLALERAYRFGLPDESAPSGRRRSGGRLPVERAAAHLRLVRRADTTRRSDIVLDWVEAALYGALADRVMNSGQSVDRAAAMDALRPLHAYVYAEADRRRPGEVRAQPPKGDGSPRRRIRKVPTWYLEFEALQQRVRMVTSLPKWHRISQIADAGAGPESPAAPLLVELVALRGVREGTAARAVELLRRLMPSAEGPDAPSLDKFLAEIRPVIDVDVFHSGDFNAVMFPLSLSSVSRLSSGEGGGIEMSGVAFVSTQVDLLESYAENLPRLNEMRAIFTLLGNHNLQVAMDAELLRSERIRHIESILWYHQQQWAALSEQARWSATGTRLLGETRTRLSGLISEVYPPVARKGLTKVADAVWSGRPVPDRVSRDLRYYAMTRLPEDSASDFVHLGNALREAWHRTEATLRDRGDRIPAFNHAPSKSAPDSPAVEVQVEREALVHLLENLLLNAAEAVRDGGAVRVRVEYVKKMHDQPEVVVDIENDAEVVPDESDESDEHKTTPRWFEPGYSTKEAPRNFGFGLASAWKIATLHGGRIWQDVDPETPVTRMRVALKRERTQR